MTRFEQTLEETKTCFPHYFNFAQSEARKICIEFDSAKWNELTYSPDFKIWEIWAGTEKNALAKLATEKNLIKCKKSDAEYFVIIGEKHESETHLKNRIWKKGVKNYYFKSGALSC